MKKVVAPARAPVAELSAKDALALTERVVRRLVPRLRDLDFGDAMSAAHEALALALREHDPSRAPLAAFITMRVQAAVTEAWRRPRRRGRHGAAATQREVSSDRVHGLDSTEETIDLGAAHRVVERALHEAALEVEAAAERRRLIEDMRRLVGDEVLGALLSDASVRDMAVAAGVTRMALFRQLQQARAALGREFGEGQKKSTRRGTRGGRRAH